MPDRSDEETVDLDELETELDDGAGGGSSTDATIEELEAELGMGDADEAGGASGAGGAESAGDAAAGGEDVGLDEDPSSQYGDLLGDAPAEGSTDRGRSDAGAEEESGGFLSGLFGGGSSADDASADAGGAAADDGPATGTDAAAGSDVLDDLDLDATAGVGDGTATDAETGAGTTTDAADDGSRLPSLGGYFSLRTFLGAIVAIAVLGGVGSTFLPLIGGAAGLFAGAFLVAFASGESRYLETVLAAVLVGALGTLLGGVSVAFAAGATTRLLAVGAVGGLVLAVLGAYFGNDLRAGLFGGDDWGGQEP